MRLFYWFLFVFLSLSSVLFSSPILENLDTSMYPLIRLKVREEAGKPIQSESIVIQETFNNERKSIKEINIVRQNQFRPIHLILSIHANEYESKNERAKAIANSILDTLTDDDKVGIHFYSNETLLMELSMSKQSAMEKLKTLTPSQGNRQNYNLLFLSENLPKSKLPRAIVSLNFSNTSILDEPIEKVVKFLKRSKVPVYVYGQETTNNSILADSTGGAFYHYKDKTSFAGLKSEVFTFRRNPPVLEYTSPFASELNTFMPSEIELGFSLRKRAYSLTYKASYINIVKSKFAKVEYFYAVSAIVLVICVWVLYTINRNIRVEVERARLKQIENVKKSDLYYQENMRELKTNSKTTVKANALTTPKTSSYPSVPNEEPKKSASTTNITKPTASIQEYEIEYDNNLPTEELSRGEEYDSAALIQKRGPNPGRQFVMNQDEIKIGSSPESDLVLWDSFISPVHARIKKINNKYILFDLYSSSGIYLNNKKLLRPKVLVDFDEIKLGKTVLIFRGKQ